MVLSHQPPKWWLVKADATKHSKKIKSLEHDKRLSDMKFIRSLMEKKF